MLSRVVLVGLMLSSSLLVAAAPTRQDSFNWAAHAIRLDDLDPDFEVTAQTLVQGPLFTFFSSGYRKTEAASILFGSGPVLVSVDVLMAGGGDVPASVRSTLIDFAVQSSAANLEVDWTPFEGPPVAEGQAWFTAQGSAEGFPATVHMVVVPFSWGMGVLIVMGFDDRMPPNMVASYAQLMIDRLTGSG